MQIITLLLAAVAMVTTMPVPPNPVVFTDSAVATNTTIEARSSMCLDCMSCKAKQQNISLKYIVRIGAPFANGAGCDSTKKSLEKANDMPAIDNFHCKDDSGMTKINFVAWDYGQGGAISQVFNRAYPAVKGDGHGFNCPDY